MSRTSSNKDDEIIDAIQSGEVGASVVGVNSKTIPTAGTAVQLSSSSVPCKRVFIQGYQSNGNFTDGGPVAVGDSSVVATIGSETGRIIYPTQGEWFKVANLNQLWLNATNNNSKVSYYYEA